MGELINEAEGLYVCGSAEDANGALKSIEELKPDLVIVDITLKNSDGIELTKQIQSQFQGILVLVVSMHDESLYAERALLAGAKGYIMKQEATVSIISAIRHVLDGNIYTSDKVKEEFLLKHVDPKYANKKDPLHRLTDREMEVFRLFGKGFSTREIADKLHLSIKTIGTYRERIKEKLNFKHLGELISYAAGKINSRL
jgi:DNA-binding NarL/FixJ family response regulator